MYQILDFVSACFTRSPLCTWYAPKCSVWLENFFWGDTGGVHRVVYFSLFIYLFVSEVQSLLLSI